MGGRRGGRPDTVRHVGHPLELRFASPFDTLHYGLLGIHANAFLAGAFDDDPYSGRWYDYPVLAEWRCEFRRERGLTLAADWAAEWLVLLRIEGARSLRFHMERYTGVQQHYIFANEAREGVVLSAWKPGLFGASCLSSWTPTLEEPESRALRRRRPVAFPVPVGLPGELNLDIIVQTHKRLDGGAVDAADPAALLARVDALYAKAKTAGYALPEFPAGSAERIDYLLDHCTRSAPIDRYSPFPCLPQDAQAEDAWRILIDAGMLRGQLDQVPERVPAHSYDDNNRGPIYPPGDYGGEVYRELWDGLRALGWEWLKLCYRPWQAPFSQPPELRLALRAPVDLAYSDRNGPEGSRGLNWVRPKAAG